MTDTPDQMLPAEPVQPPAPRPARRWPWAVSVLLVLALCVVCANRRSGSGTVDDRYRQTWGKAYSATTCTEWRDRMTSKQRFAAAADMLVGARKADGVAGGDALPDDPVIDRFVAAVSDVCSAAPTWSVAETGASVYATDRIRFGP